MKLILFIFFWTFSKSCNIESFQYAAVLSNLAYLKKSINSIEGETEISGLKERRKLREIIDEPDICHFKLIDSRKSKPKILFYSYHKANCKEPLGYLFAFRGTEISIFADLKADLDIMIDIVPKYVLKATKWVKTELNKIQNNEKFPFYAVGHSLGGFIAQIVCFQIKNCKSIAIEPPGTKSLENEIQMLNPGKSFREYMRKDSKIYVSMPNLVNLAKNFSTSPVFIKPRNPDKCDFYLERNCEKGFVKKVVKMAWTMFYHSIESILDWIMLFKCKKQNMLSQMSEFSLKEVFKIDKSLGSKIKKCFVKNCSKSTEGKGSKVEEQFEVAQRKLQGALYKKSKKFLEKFFGKPTDKLKLKSISY